MSVKGNNDFNELFLELKCHQESRQNVKGSSKLPNRKSNVAKVESLVKPETKSSLGGKRITYSVEKMSLILKSIPESYFEEIATHLPNRSFWRISYQKKPFAKIVSSNPSEHYLISNKGSRNNDAKMEYSEQYQLGHISPEIHTPNDIASPTSLFSKFFSMNSNSTASSENSLNTSPLTSPLGTKFGQFEQQSYFPAFSQPMNLNGQTEFSSVFLDSDTSHCASQYIWNNNNEVGKITSSFPPPLFPHSDWQPLLNHTNPITSRDTNITRRQSTSSTKYQNNLTPFTTTNTTKSRSYSNPENRPLMPFVPPSIDHYLEGKENFQYEPLQPNFPNIPNPNYQFLSKENFSYFNETNQFNNTQQDNPMFFRNTDGFRNPPHIINYPPSLFASLTPLTGPFKDQGNPKKVNH